jgi:hypothetical protein
MSGGKPADAANGREHTPRFVPDVFFGDALDVETDGTQRRVPGGVVCDVER